MLHSIIPTIKFQSSPPKIKSKSPQPSRYSVTPLKPSSPRNNPTPENRHLLPPATFKSKSPQPSPRNKPSRYVVTPLKPSSPRNNPTPENRHLLPPAAAAIASRPTRSQSPYRRGGDRLPAKTRTGGRKMRRTCIIRKTYKMRRNVIKGG